MRVSYELNPEERLTKEQETMLKDLKKRPIVFDEDSPMLTEDDLKGFYRP